MMFFIVKLENILRKMMFQKDPKNNQKPGKNDLKKDDLYF